MLHRPSHISAMEDQTICVLCFCMNSMHFDLWPRLYSQCCLFHGRLASEEPMGWYIHSHSAVQVLYDMMMPLPTPETVAIHPVRVLMEKASKRHFTLRFWVDRRADHQYDVDGYINLYLIARCSSGCCFQFVAVSRDQLLLKLLAL